VYHHSLLVQDFLQAFLSEQGGGGTESADNNRSPVELYSRHTQSSDAQQAEAQPEVPQGAGYTKGHTTGTGDGDGPDAAPAGLTAVDGALPASAATRATPQSVKAPMLSTQPLQQGCSAHGTLS
jgi:hypothetical protein